MLTEPSQCPIGLRFVRKSGRKSSFWFEKKGIRWVGVRRFVWGASVQYSLFESADGVSLSLSVSSAGGIGFSWFRWECVFCIG